MTRSRLPLLSLSLAVLACALAACGVGEGEQGGEATVVVTRDFGATEVGRETASGVPAGETMMRLLQKRFDVETRYGGGFVQSIDGLAGGRSGGREVDWFFYVNGIESSAGANARKVSQGDVIWWDHHDWSAAMRIPAVVGSFPEPFLSGEGGKRIPVRIDCAPAAERECDEVQKRLVDAGVQAVSKAAPRAGTGTRTLRLLVGTWSDIRADRAALLLEQGPAESGVFARPAEDGSRIELLDERGEVERTLDAGAGLVAATRYVDQQATWFVTGTDAAGVAAAAAAVDADVLQNHFAVAIEDGRGVPLPVRPERP
jgi:hypothetical protein